MKSCVVDVWSIRLDVERPRVLTAEEQARADRFRFERDRVHWSNARSALRCVLASYLRLRPLDFDFTFGRFGKPAVEAIQFNLSHAGDWAMIAVTPDTPVGIDIEHIREEVDMPKLLKRIGETELSGTPAQLFQVWTRREAKTKALGGTLMEIPKARLCVADLEAPAGYTASVALLEAEPVVRYCDAGGL